MISISISISNFRVQLAGGLGLVVGNKKGKGVRWPPMKNVVEFRGGGDGLAAGGCALTMRLGVVGRRGKWRSWGSPVSGKQMAASRGEGG